MFTNEEALSQVFDIALFDNESPFLTECIAKEFDYREGRTDIIASDSEGNLIAFEMKLDKWKQALYQAYRNSSFAHFSYVVVPLKVAQRAMKYKYEFTRRGVGLCSVEKKRIEIEIKAKRVEPLRPWLTESAFEFIYGDNYVKSSKVWRHC